MGVLLFHRLSYLTDRFWTSLAICEYFTEVKYCLNIKLEATVTSSDQRRNGSVTAVIVCSKQIVERLTFPTEPQLRNWVIKFKRSIPWRQMHHLSERGNVYSQCAEYYGADTYWHTLEFYVQRLFLIKHWKYIIGCIPKTHCMRKRSNAHNSH